MTAGRAAALAEALTVAALSDIRDGDAEAIELLEAAAAALRVEAGELPAAELDDLAELAESLDLRGLL